ncbi:hypothetical protein ABPG74_015099 [Tetrahymena malaccensis]
MSLKDPLVQTENTTKSEYVPLSYEDQPSGVIDYVVIGGLMLSTYTIIVAILYGLISWATDTGNTQANNNKYYHENMYFNLVIFLVYIVACGSLWFFRIGKRDIYRQRLMEEQLALKENLK